MATLEETRKCSHCKREMRTLVQKTANKELSLYACDNCDGKLKLFAKFET